MDIKRFLEQYHVFPNADQEKAISHTQGPALVLAGPGSGKTTVITARCACLAAAMEQGLLPVTGILTVAFNRAAAQEMAQRYNTVFQNKAPLGQRVDFSTFHAFCNRVIARYEEKQGIRLERVDETKRQQILAELYETENPVRLTPAERKKLAGEISRLQTQMVGQRANREVNYTALSMSNFKNLPKIHQAYIAYKQKHGYIDFDDMLSEGKRILTTCPDILKEITSTYGFFQVDEGQDLSEVQMEILTLLSQNIFLVGDDDQGIYGFRGAKPESIVHIKQYFPGCTTYYLKQNYRSTQRIVQTSGNLIRKNEVRVDKTFFTEKGKGKKPKCQVFLDDRDWLAFLAVKIRNHKDGTCGILYRNGASSVLPMLMCYRQGIPFTITGGQGAFFESFVTKDLLSMFTYEAGRKRIWERKPEKVLREYLKSGYLMELRTRCETVSLRYEDMLRYVSAWDYLTMGLSDCEQVLKRFDGFYRAAAAAGAGGDSKVHLSTVHSAKGLEYDTVFIIDLYDGEFPKRGDDRIISEERRLFYVAMTRARKQLYLLYPARRFDKELAPSLFWQEVKALTPGKLFFHTP